MAAVGEGGLTVNAAPLASIVVGAEVGIATEWLPMTTVEGKMKIGTLFIVVENGRAGGMPVADAVTKGEFIIEAMILPSLVVPAGTGAAVLGIDAPLPLDDARVPSLAVDTGVVSSAAIIVDAVVVAAASVVGAASVVVIVASAVVTVTSIVVAVSTVAGASAVASVPAIVVASAVTTTSIIVASAVIVIIAAVPTTTSCRVNADAPGWKDSNGDGACVEADAGADSDRIGGLGRGEAAGAPGGRGEAVAFRLMVIGAVLPFVDSSQGHDGGFTSRLRLWMCRKGGCCDSACVREEFWNGCVVGLKNPAIKKYCIKRATARMRIKKTTSVLHDPIPRANVGQRRSRTGRIMRTLSREDSRQGWSVLKGTRSPVKTADTAPSVGPSISTQTTIARRRAVEGEARWDVQAVGKEPTKGHEAETAHGQCRYTTLYNIVGGGVREAQGRLGWICSHSTWKTRNIMLGGSESLASADYLTQLRTYSFHTPMPEQHLLMSMPHLRHATVMPEFLTQIANVHLYSEISSIATMTRLSVGNREVQAPRASPVIWRERRRWLSKVPTLFQIGSAAWKVNPRWSGLHCLQDSIWGVVQVRRVARSSAKGEKSALQYYEARRKVVDCRGPVKACDIYQAAASVSTTLPYTVVGQIPIPYGHPHAVPVPVGLFLQPGKSRTLKLSWPPIEVASTHVVHL
ncbi:hypothetical protein KCU88_g58, partial [Aureobasidium melanogenum]